MTDIHNLPIIVSSHGVKTGPMPAAHYYVDARSVWCPVGNHKGMTYVGTGDDQPIQDAVEEKSDIESILKLVDEAIGRTPARRNYKPDWYKHPFHICVLCAWGVHRSRAVKHIIADYLKMGMFNVEVK